MTLIAYVKRKHYCPLDLTQANRNMMVYVINTWNSKLLFELLDRGGWLEKLMLCPFFFFFHQFRFIVFFSFLKLQKLFSNSLWVKDVTVIVIVSVIFNCTIKCVNYSVATCFLLSTSLIMTFSAVKNDICMIWCCERGKTLRNY